MATTLSLLTAPAAGGVTLRRTARPAIRSVRAARFQVRAAEDQAEKVTGVVFEPFSEVASELATVETAPLSDSLARAGYTLDCEAAVNEQINIEYNVSYVYHALFAYFDRDNVGLPGFAKFFKDSSEEEREHAEMLMEFQNRRGGRVKLQSIMMPEMEFDNQDKGEALYAMELALSLEKLNFQKLRALHAVADAAGDAQMCDFIEGQLLGDQVEDIKKVSEYVSQLRRVGKGHGVFHFDKELAEAA